MKKILCACLCIISLLILNSCGKKESDYRKAIPADAGMVMGLNLQSIAEKSGMSGEAGQAQIAAYLEQSMDASLYNYLMGLMAEPEESGLDLSQPLCFYMTSSKEVGIVAKVIDEEKTQTLLDRLGEESDLPSFLSVKGVSYSQPDNRSVVAFNESSLLLMGNSDDASSSSAAERAVVLLNQSEEESFLSQEELFNTFTNLHGDLTCVLSYGSVIPVQYKALLQSCLPQGISWNDLGASLDCSFEKGKIAITCENHYLSDAAKEWSKKAQKAYIPLKGTFIPDAEPMCWLGMGVNGEKVFEQIMAGENNAEQLKAMEPLLRKSLANMDGDVSLSVSNAIPTTIRFDFELKEGKGEETIEALVELLEEYAGFIATPQATPHLYSMMLPGCSLVFGLESDNHLYCLLNGMPGNASAEPLLNWASEAKGNAFYFRFNMNSLLAMLAPLMESEANIEFLNIFDYLYCKQGEDAGKVLTEIVMKNQKENALKQIIDLLKPADE